MEQYSNLNVHGKIKQLTTQSGRTPDNAEVVRYDTLTGRVPATLPTPAAANEGKAIISNGTGFEFGEAGKVDDVQLDSTTVVNNKIASISTGTGLTSSSGTINHSNSVTAETSGKGSATAIPIIKYDAQGHITEVTTATVYPPTTAGTSGYVWKSDGSGVAQWSQVTGTAPITVTNTSATKTTITHDTSGPSSSADTSVDDASKTLTITVDKFGHTKTLTGKSIQIAESQVTDLSTDLGNKVDKTTTASKIYATTSGSSVSQTTLSYSTAATADHIVQRRTGGQITVPSTPSADTDAASKAFVNSSVGTNTATFRGTYNAVSDLGNTQATVDTWADPPTSTVETLVVGQIATKMTSLSITPENNDYCFVSVDQTPTSDPGEDWYWRFKYSDPDNDHTGSWEYEYTLNNSSFTQAQWDAITSGITSTKVSTYDNYPTTLANKLVVGASNSATANAAVADSTNSIFLNLTEGGSVASNSSHNIVGSGATKVASDANGKITISSTDVSVTASSNHYTPSTASGQDKTASASGATAAWSIDVVKGVTLNTDGKGHVTGISVTSGKIPANPNTDAKVQQKGITTNGEYPILLKYDTGTTDVTANYVNFGKATSAVPTINPSTGNVTAPKVNGLTLTTATTGFTIAGGTTSKTLTVPETYTLAAACAKAVTDSSSASAIGTGTSLPTERDIYYGLPTINNSHAYTSSTTIYAPSAAGTANQILKSSGGTSAPVWTDITSLMPIAATDVTLADM